MTRFSAGFAVLCFLAAVGVSAAERPADLHDSLIGVIMSSSGRVGVGGLSPLLNLQVAMQAEDLLQRMEAALGRPVLPPHGKIVVAVTPAEGSHRGAIRWNWDRGGSRPEIQVLWDEKCSSEDVLEAVAGVVLDYLYRLSSEKVAPQANMPWWLSCGLAHYIRPAVRSHDLQQALAAWEDELLPPVAELIRQEPPPPGRWLEKCAAGALFTWLVEDSGGLGSALKPFFRRSPDARDSDWEQVLADVLAGGVSEQLQPGWDLFVAGCVRYASGPEVPSYFALRRIKRALTLDGAQLGALLGREAATAPQLADLIELPAHERGLVSAWLSVRLQWAVPAGSDEVLRVFRLYGNFLRLLARPRLDPRLVRESLARAEALFRRYYEDASREVYLVPPAPAGDRDW